ncbi:hypothetical protein LEP1GSC050_2814 [Leptospira broomii serovar Hurstbridge str. 5399]|uniref:Uncharacterized protein n=1 Tax=Leptospira broomii serovar Hurstbridge str. 5399 TaxID=1049789 RepID=T0GIF2_9LEPT|nr:hypothetical protein [Leptospira broomii]EQA45173.1 hypothetical protein LEP1GSC050_2814 [Leptospira broomii serovar Hurstbridge str. 5399]
MRTGNITLLVLLVVSITITASPKLELTTKAQDYYDRTKFGPSGIFSDPSWAFVKSLIIHSVLINSKITYPDAIQNCINDPICFPYSLIQWSIADAKEIDLVFQSLIQINLIQKIEIIPSSGISVKYNPQAIPLLYNKFYEDAKNTFSGPQLQEIYNLKIKKWLRARVKMTRAILSNKLRFENLSSEYEYGSQNDPNFNGTAASTNISKLIGCSVSDLSTYKDIPGFKCDERWVGMLVRRNNDGSLPVILQTINQILKDFDFEEYQKGTLSLESE